MTARKASAPARTSGRRGSRVGEAVKPAPLDYVRLCGHLRGVAVVAADDRVRGIWCCSAGSWLSGGAGRRSGRPGRETFGPAGGHGAPVRGAVSASTWNRFIAALDKWAEWAVYEKLIEAPPFRYADVTVWTPHRPARIRVNAEREPGEVSRAVRCQIGRAA